MAVCAARAAVPFLNSPEEFTRCFLVLGFRLGSEFVLLLTYFLYKYHVSHENKKEIQLSAVKTLKGSVSMWSKPFF